MFPICIYKQYTEIRQEYKLHAMYTHEAKLVDSEHDRFSQNKGLTQIQAYILLKTFHT